MGRRVATTLEFLAVGISDAGRNGLWLVSREIGLEDWSKLTSYFSNNSPRLPIRSCGNRRLLVKPKGIRKVALVNCRQVSIAYGRYFQGQSDSHEAALFVTAVR
jgi:hypothetical protein